VDSQLGLVSFVALLNFTAGMWICQSIHSLGAEASDDEYDGVINDQGLCQVITGSTPRGSGVSYC